MSVHLGPMTPEEFASYEEADAHRYAEGMVRAGYWPPEGALQRAKDTHAKLLPEGVQTKDHLFFAIVTPSEAAAVGALWLSIDRQSSPPTGFIYDLILDEPYRGQGIGRQAMLALETEAKRLGLSGLALDVFQDNAPARALYSSLGYQVKSMNMTKTLSDEEKPGAA